MQTRGGGVASLGPPSLTANSTYGSLAINGMIAPKAAATSVQVRLASFAGDIKAVLSGGAISGTYDVATANGGIGHVGIVIDNTPTTATHGTLGSGNASVTIEHSYGNVALALSTKAPSVFAGISGGLLHDSAGPGGTAGGLTGGGASGQEQPQCTGEGDVGAPGHAGRDAGLPQSIWWMGPLANALAAAGESVDETRREAEEAAQPAAVTAA